MSCHLNHHLIFTFVILLFLFAIFILITSNQSRTILKDAYFIYLLVISINGYCHTSFTSLSGIWTTFGPHLINTSKVLFLPGRYFPSLSSTRRRQEPVGRFTSRSGQTRERRERDADGSGGERPQGDPEDPCHVERLTMERL